VHQDIKKINFNFPHHISLLTQYWSREVVEAVYKGITPKSGYNGDEDQGLMGSLAVLMKIGLFSMKSGCSLKPQLELGNPVFDKITIHLNQEYYKGKTISIKTIGNSPENRFIQSVMLNDKELNTWCLSQDTLVDGAELVLQMGNQPNRSRKID
jgi:putative alpha-1,2-mannosidase